MVVGHTKFAPDGHFGLWKLKWRNSTAETLEDIAKSVKTSSKNGHNVPHLVSDGTSPVKFFSWRNFLCKFFKALPGITKYHHFFITAHEPGVVTCKVSIHSPETKVSLLKCKPENVTGTPVELVPQGLDLARQWYLYESIRDYVRSDIAKDVICPRPSITKPCLKK